MVERRQPPKGRAGKFKDSHASDVSTMALIALKHSKASSTRPQAACESIHDYLVEPSLTHHLFRPV